MPSLRFFNIDTCQLMGDSIYVANTAFARAEKFWRAACLCQAEVQQQQLHVGGGGVTACVCTQHAASASTHDLEDFKTNHNHIISFLRHVVRQLPLQPSSSAGPGRAVSRALPSRSLQTRTLRARVSGFVIM